MSCDTHACAQVVGKSNTIHDERFGHLEYQGSIVGCVMLCR
jgi:hypothetical protein